MFLLAKSSFCNKNINKQTNVNKTGKQKNMA
jgi:hypothetical protein